MKNYKVKFIKQNTNTPERHNLTIDNVYEGYVTTYKEFKVLCDDDGGFTFLSEGEYKVITNERYILINI